MATIGFADDAHPAQGHKPDGVEANNSTVNDSVHQHKPRRAMTDRSISSEDNNDGIYNMRDVTRTFSRATSKGRSSNWNWKRGNNEPEDDDPGIQRSGDFRQKEVFHGRLLLWLSYQSVGAIYGDIGTSPLYVYSSTFKGPPSYDDLVGVLSIVIWSLTLMVTVKYVLVILRADNNGEGGTFSTYSLLSRYVNITNRDPREASLIQMKRFNTGDLEGTGGKIRRGLEHSKLAKELLKIIGVLAVSMVMSDGVLTPAQSVLGAVQGLNVVVPSISNATVVGTTAGILILLFLIQPLGTSKLATAFAPIIIIWLLFNSCFGIYNLAKYDHSVLVAFNPGHAFEYLIRNKNDGWKSLGGVLLAFTGVEALFADLGAFSMRAIQISWLCFTFPCLLLAYIGQAAYISQNPAAYSNPFFNSVPNGWVTPSLIIAILAAIVASQAIITATFQLLAQTMKLSYFPQVKVVHTSKIFHGQLYVPLVNWLLMIGTVLVAAIYNNTTSLGNAYGVCVMFVTFFDTCMVSLAAMFVWRISPFIVFFPWIIIACLDGAYLSAALVKVPDGAWFTLTLSGILTALFILWRFGKEQQWAAEAVDRFPTTHFVKKQQDGSLQLTPAYGGASISPVKGFGIFFDKDGTTIPPVFSQFIIKLVAAPEVMVLFHLRPLETPSVRPEERYNVSRLAVPNCYRLVVRHGYSDVVISPDLAQLIHDQIQAYIIRDNKTPHLISGVGVAGHDKSKEEEKENALDAMSATGFEKTTPHSTFEESSDNAPQVTFRNTAQSNPIGVPPQSTSSALAKLEEAYNHQVLYIIGKSQLIVAPGGGIFRQVLLHAWLWIRENTRTKIASLKIPMDRVFEVGFVKDI
ncbi:hypothetical protein MMC13_006347 [Lambiella insularis]|nr:hypothetical protein [Lambiella insularis]